MNQTKQQDNDLLKQAGLKVTSPRLKILALLQESANPHVNAEDLYRKLIEQGEEIGLATVYRVLNQFEEVGLITKHHFEGGKAIFELASPNSHDHLICLDCGAVFEFEDDLIRKRQAEIAKSHGIKLSYHNFSLYGHCSNGDCKKNPELHSKNRD